MDLLQSFKDYIANERLFAAGDALLVAVSGGLDSVVLCELCHRAGYSFSMAHANFQLRGEESERDEEFVRQLAAKYGRELFLRRFDTQEYADGQKVSVQVAARELRYGWFREVAGQMSLGGPGQPGATPSAVKKEAAGAVGGNAADSLETKAAGSKPSLILTAHHLDDNIETVLMNFFKGTGIGGLHGILPKQGGLVRPLLFTGKEALEKFARENALSWVEDSSNLSDKYTRNYFRHELIPLVERVYPGALENLAGNIGRFREIEALYRQSVERHKSKLIERRGEEIHIPALKLKKTEPLHTMVYEIIREFGFSSRQVDEVVKLLDSGSGKYVSSVTHRILKNRNWLIIAPVQSAAAATFLIESAEEKLSYEGGELSLALVELGDGAAGEKRNEGRLHKESRENESKEKESGAKESGGKDVREKEVKAGLREQVKTGDAQDKHIACLDAADIRWPLLLRKWRQGDYFYPLGMRKKKKLGRFFIDNKLSRGDREKAWVIEMDKKIIWVVGHRIDDRYRIGAGTRTILTIELKPR
jgi:tRNA(Ile)-lysidine synthase